MNISALLFYAVLNGITPGANNIMAMTNASKVGFVKGLRFCTGAAIGFFICITLCVSLDTLLFQYVSQIEPIMKWLGAAYILFLAYLIIRNSSLREKSKLQFESNSITTGIIMQFINVKVILYGLTAFSTFILPYNNSLLSIAKWVIILTLISTSCNCCWALCGSLFQHIFEKYSEITNIIMASLLVYCAIISVIE